MVSPLRAVLVEGDVRLEPLAAHHREGLRRACPEDDPVWEIYPFKRAGDDFDRQFDEDLAVRDQIWLVAHKAGQLAGITSYMHMDRRRRALEIGGTYFAPHMRGTGLNSIVKRLMIDHAYASGYKRIEFRIDARNTRSQKAVLKLGARHERTLQRNRTTWTGFVRDTMIFGLLADDGAGG